MTTAPVIVGAPTHAAVVGATITVPLPSVTYQPGDLVVVAIRNQGSAFTADAPLGLEAGWSRIGAAIDYNAPTGTRFHGFYAYRVSAGTAVPSTASFTAAWLNNNRSVLIATVVRGVHWQTPLAGSSGYYNAAITRGREFAAYDLAGLDALTLMQGGAEVTSGNTVGSSAAGGYALVDEWSTQTATNTSRTAAALYQRAATASPQGTSSVVWLAGGGASVEAISLLGGPQVDPGATTPPPAGLAVTSGAKQTAKAFYTKGDGTFGTPSSLLYIPRGFTSVAQALATPGFTCGHRGNSIMYAELSMRAMTQTVVRGYGMLELSLARTSDGVWFGLHDSTLDRTSGVTGNLDPKTMTWAQVQTYMNVSGAENRPQPYAKIEDIVAAYGDSHSFMVDPKYVYGSMGAEFWALCDAIGRERVLVKFFGPLDTIGKDAASRGYASWGYYYDADIANGSLAATAGSWSTLGLTYSSSQANWDIIKSYGKPVLGHIAPDQAAYDMAMAKGADGVQCSGTHVIRAKSWWNA